MPAHQAVAPYFWRPLFIIACFCLLQTNTLVLTGFVLLMVRIYLSVACGIISHAQARSRTWVADHLLRKTRTFILILYAIGRGCIGAPTIWFELKA